MKTLQEAKDTLFAAFDFSRYAIEETVSVPDSVGRILSQPAVAKMSSPGFHVAAMDGIAVKAENTYGISETRPGELTVNTDAFYVNTGHVMPENTNAVIMIEHVQEIDDDRVRIEAPAFPWQYVRRVGEDIVATELLFARNHVITPYCVGALLAGGLFSIPVKKKPAACIIPTGSELVDVMEAEKTGAPLKPGQVIESNSFVLGNLITSYGGTFIRHPLVKDNVDDIRAIVCNAAEDDAVDFILIDGGSSAGSQDYSKRVIEDLGNILIHGVTIMPGKPVIIGDIKGKPVFGIPGYPVSAIIAFEQFVGPMVLKMLGQPDREPEKIQVELSRKVTSRLGIEEFLRVKLGQVDNRIIATPLPKGAGSITSLTEADGIIRIPNHSEGINEHTPVQAELFRSLSSLKKTIVAVGSHDNSLDVLADMLKAGDSQVILSSSHVGSLGGIMAIRKGVCHIAGSHLLDTEDGTYNLSYIKKYLPSIKTRLVNLVIRDQGLIIPKGNPKHIHCIEDLTQKNVTFINRQSGSGTRILLDFQLEKLKIQPDTIQGYADEEFTHMAVAVSVQSGAADVGLGIFAAAKALDLDFIPVVTEEYDLVIPEIYFNTNRIQTLLRTINSEEFKTRVTALGGYSMKRTGQIRNP